MDKSGRAGLAIHRVGAEPEGARACSRWLDRGNGPAAYTRDTLATITRWPLRRVLLAGLIGITLSSAAGWAVAHHWEERTAQGDINDLGENRRLLLQNRLTDLEQTMALVAARFQNSASEIDHANFARATGEVNNILGKMLEFDWLPRIVRRGRVSHERTATGQDLPGSHMNARGNDGSLVPADAQDEHYPILYSSQPTASSHIGMDIGSDPAEREAMSHARDSGRLAATPPITGTSDIFLFAPVYGLDLPHEGVEDRRSTLEGFIRGTFVPGPLIDQIFRGVKSPQGLDIYFFRPGASPNELPFHVRSSLLRSEPAKARPGAELEAGLHWTGEAVLADTRWTMIVVPIPGSPMINHQRSLAVLAVGLLLTMLFMAYVELSRRHALRLEAIAIDLRGSEEKFHLLAESAHNGFIMADDEGKVRFWNPAAERVFGYTSEEILGRRMHENSCPRTVSRQSGRGLRTIRKNRNR